jgi:hypothetical protein
MNKKRILVVVGGSILVLSIVLVALGFNLSPRAEGSSIPYVGMGEVQRFDASQSKTVKGLVVGSIASGMGSLQRYDASQPKANNHQVVAGIASGMGEVQRFDAVQSIALEGNAVRSISTGMGDLHRYESTQGSIR